MKTINSNDIQISTLNNQKWVRGTSISVKDDDKIFFILSVDGTTVTLKDKDGNAVTIVSNRNYYWPLRLEGGFEATAAASATVVYSIIIK